MKIVRKIPQYLLDLCREFRKHPTETEAMIWSCLRNRRLRGHKFRRQFPIGRSIADFYCHELRLVIEIDGGVHLEMDQRQYDYVRQRELEDQGYAIVRITTAQIKRSPRQSILRIIHAIESLKSPSPPSPLPMGEGRKG